MILYILYKLLYRYIVSQNTLCTPFTVRGKKRQLWGKMKMFKRKSLKKSGKVLEVWNSIQMCKKDGRIRIWGQNWRKINFGDYWGTPNWRLSQYLQNWRSYANSDFRNGFLGVESFWMFFFHGRNPNNFFFFSKSPYRVYFIYFDRISRPKFRKIFLKFFRIFSDKKISCESIETNKFESAIFEISTIFRDDVKFR